MTVTTMNDLFALYETECVPELEPRTQRDYRSILDILRASFGHLEPQAVRPKHVAEFINVKTGRVHRNRMVTILSSVFKIAMGSWCIDEDLVNPCTVVKKWKTKPRTRYVTTDEYNRFRATCGPQVQIAMDLAVIMGQRQGDLINLKWSQVKTLGLPREQWYVEVDQSKTGKELGILISPALETVLQRAKMMLPHWPREYVLRTKFGLGYTPDGFRAMWQRYCRAWGKAGNPRFHFHDLRAKAGSDHKSVQHAFALLGHQDIKMTARVYERNRRMVEPSR
jgi:integrase